MRDFTSNAKKVLLKLLYLQYISCVEERLRRMNDKLKKTGFEPVPTEIQRAQESLTLIFKQFDLDPIANKALYDTLVDWKRTL